METEDENARKYTSPEDIFNVFCDAEDFQEILYDFKELCRTLRITSGEGITFYHNLKANLKTWKCQALWDLLDARANQAAYGQGKFGENVRVFIIGAGPIGLRTAIECAFLGCKVVVVDKRKTFTRNNVLHLWTFLLHDFRALGAKKFYGKFGSGSIDHVSIRVLQAILLKSALLLGVQIFSEITFEELVEPSTPEDGWRAKCTPDDHPVNKWRFNVVIGADGKKNVLPGFKQIEMRGKVAIGITCNFANYNTIEESAVQEISGIAYQFKPDFFNNLNAKQGVQLENLVYYKDATHYFVMTAVKSSLLNRGVLKQDFSDPSKLLQRSNIDQDELVSYTSDAVNYATDYQLPKLDLVELPTGGPDIALFDFTSIKKASNACRVLERKGQRLLLALVGDSLLEPFWPTGSGCGRGVLSALDTAWMIRQYGKGYPPLYIIRDRENIFKLLSGTSNDNLQKNINAYTIDPKTRYSNVSSKKMMTAAQLKSFYDTDDPEHADYSVAIPDEKGVFEIGVRFPINKTKAGRRKSAGRRRSSSKARTRRKSSQTDPRTVTGSHEELEGKGRPSKRSKPSGSQSGSMSSGLHSISESDQEMRSGSVSSLTYSRQNSHTTHSMYESSESGLDSRRGTRASQSELDDVFLSSSPGKEEFANRYKRSSSKEDDSHKSKSWFRRKVSQHKSNQDTERKHAAARKSIGNAKKHRLRRLSREHGALPVSKDKENRAKPGDITRCGSGKVKELRQALASEYSQDQSSQSMKQPLESKMSSGSIKNGKVQVKNGDRITMTKSAKELIAEAEARERLKKESFKGVPSEERTVPRSLKRKVDEPNTANKRKSLNRELGSIVGDIMNVDATTDINESMSTEKLLEVAMSRAAGLLLAVPLLLTCNKVPRINSSQDLKSEQQTKQKDAIKPSTSFGKGEGEQFQRAGSVQKKRAEYLAMISRRESERKSFHDFKRMKSGVSQADGDASETASVASYSSQVSLDQTDFVAKDVIDAETCLLPESEEIKRGSHRDNKKLKSVPKVEDPLKCRDSMTTVLERLKKELRPSSQETAISILVSIHKKIQQNSNNEMYYRIHVMGEMFQKYVWNVHAARDFMDVVGWTRCGSFLLLSKSVIVSKAVTQLEEILSSVQIKTFGGRQESLNDKVRRLDVPQTRKIRKWGSVPSSVVRQNTPELARKTNDIIDNLDETSVDDIEHVTSKEVEKENERVFTDSNYIGDNEYLVLSYSESDSKAPAPIMYDAVRANENRIDQETNKNVKEAISHSNDTADTGKLDTELSVSDNEDKDAHISVSHSDTVSKKAAGEPPEMTETSLVSSQVTPHVAQQAGSPDSDIDQRDQPDKNDNLERITFKPPASQEPERMAEAQSWKPPADQQTDSEGENLNSKKDKPRGKLSLALGFRKGKKSRGKSLSSPMSEPDGPLSPSDQNGVIDDSRFEPVKRERTRSKLSLAFGTKSSKKDQKNKVRSPTSESEGPVSPGASGPHKKKRKSLIRIVKKLKRQGSKSVDELEPPSLVPDDGLNKALSASWADIKEQEALAMTSDNQTVNIAEQGETDVDEVLVNGIETDEKNTITNNNGHPVMLKEKSNTSLTDLVDSIPQSDSGLCSNDEFDSIASKKEMASSDDNEEPVKQKKKKRRFLKIKKKKGQQDKKIVSDISTTDPLGRDFGKTNVSGVREPVSYSDITTFEKVIPKDISKKSKRDWSPPSRNSGKLKSISTEAVEI